MSRTVKVNGTEQDSGCWIDGHWGQYGASRVLSICDELLSTDFYTQAVSEGAEVGMMVSELEGSEIVSEIADEAESALNEVTQFGFYWSWHDGEFFLSSSRECECVGPLHSVHCWWIVSEDDGFYQSVGDPVVDARTLEEWEAETGCKVSDFENYSNGEV